MRTDYKIGLAVVLFVVVVFIIYSLAVSSRPSEPSGAPANKDTEAIDASVRDEPVLVGLEEFFSGPGEDAAASRVSTPHIAGITETPISQATPLVAMDNSTPDTHSPAASTGSDESDSSFADEATGESNPTAGDRIYVVKENNLGFWTVSQEVYGSGKYWYLIAKANPSADSYALRPGQKLKIPPLPATVKKSSRPVTPVVKSGTYIVREGDLGFWTVAENVYGHGKYWRLIEEANRGVRSDRLRAGMELIVPPLTPAGSRNDSSVNRNALQPGEKWYVVQEGDKGFWDVAKRNYNAGKYWKLIERRNRPMDSLRLRPGQRLIIPPLPSRSATQPAYSAGNQQASSSEPLFE